MSGFLEKLRSIFAPTYPALIFSVTPGRSGTAFLSEVLRIVPGTVSEHEPEPNFVSVMRKAQKDPRLAADFLRRRKLPAIARLKTKHYVETSHLFCKGFFEPMLESRIPFGLVSLRRPPSQVARSLLERETVPGRTQPGLDYLLMPDDPGVLPVRDRATLTDYQLCFWYALEIERRQLAYAQTCGREGIRFFEVDHTELSDWTIFKALCEALGMSLPETDAKRAEHAAVSAVQHNPNWKRLDAMALGGASVEEEDVWARITPPFSGFRRQVEATSAERRAAPLS